MQLPIKFVVAVVLALPVVACNTDKTHTAATSFDSTIPKVKPVDTTAALRQKNDADSLPMRTVGNMVLDGSFTPTDDPATFRLMDSLQANTKESRRFYFSVFNKIMDRADGALGEAIGDYTLTYVEQFPAEFIEFSKDFTNERMETWASNVGIELSLSANDPKEGYANYDDLVTRNCKGCNKQTQQRLQQFNKMVWRTVKENIAAESRSE
jgi:hypothetical protein